MEEMMVDENGVPISDLIDGDRVNFKAVIELSEKLEGRASIDSK
jgi:hypothetical protein